MKTIGVRLYRLNLYEGPIAVRLVDRTNNFHYDSGSVTDGALAERLASHKPGSPAATEEITCRLSARPAEAAFDERWPTFEHAIEHWAGGRSGSPIRRVKWACRNPACGFVNDVQIGARCRETVPLRCRQCARTQRVMLGEGSAAPAGASTGG